jgi:hypothetical protein
VSRDRVTHRPKSLKSYLRWAQTEYQREPPVRLHGRAIEDDGDPAMTGETKGYLGFHDKREPNDWRAIACSLDADGFHKTPMRCAIESIRDPNRRRLVRGIVTRTFYVGDVARSMGIPDWCAADVVLRSLEMLWDQYSDRPIPRPSVGWVDKSESQQKAEDAA